MSIQPPFYDDLGPAPTGVCSRWMGDSPCGAAATHHVIWDLDLINGAMCAAHEDEARHRWVWIGLHPYTDDCAAFTSGDADWLPGEDRCARMAPHAIVAAALASTPGK
jgi:hypothetical protein